MYVIKSNGKKESIKFDKIATRIKQQAYDLNSTYVEPLEVAKKVIQGIYDGITTKELDEAAAETAAALMPVHPDYGILAGRIAISALHKRTSKNFSEVVEKLYNHKNSKTAEHMPRVTKEFYDIVTKNAELLDDSIDYTRDFSYDYFGYKTLEKAYLFQLDRQVVERPQHLIMRVAVGIHGDDMGKVIESYNYMSQKLFTHATPTLYNMGTARQQSSSCFLMGIKEGGDSINGIYSTLRDVALISKNAGGIGIHIHKIRSKDAFIKGTNGVSNGIVPMLRVFDATARYVDQCFEYSTPVFTPEGLRKIGSLKVGDLVLSEDGNYNPIKNVLQYNSEDKKLFQIKLKGVSEIVTVTEEHPLFSILNKDNFQSFEIETRIKNKVVEVAYQDVKDLWINDYLIFPNTEQVKEKIKYFIEDENFLYCQIEDIVEFKNKSLELFDFDVENHPSYTTVIGIAHNGGGKRKGSFAIYLEPWHSDIYDFLDMKKNNGKEELRARDLFYALFVPDLFMQRLRDGEEWSLFDPSEAPGLDDVWGEEFNKLYHQYEQEGRARKKVSTKDLAIKIAQAQIETGMPYMAYKDAINAKSNQKNIGIIKSSNLCIEIVEYSGELAEITKKVMADFLEELSKKCISVEDETAVCNLASVAINKFVKERKYDFDLLGLIVSVVTRNLNKVIDNNYYPIPETMVSNFAHRPIGIGVQGWADTLALMHLPFDSQEARKLNRNIFETMYFHALKTSMEIAKQEGPYPSYEGSPISQGIFQFDMWGVFPDSELGLDWEWLREEVKKYGVRNSLLMALMPTGSTSQILGNYECFEPINSNLYARRTNAGEFFVVNSYLVKDLIKLGLWNSTTKQMIMASGGSIALIPNIPDEIKEIYKTAYELSQKSLLDQAADRGAFIDQTQSMNLFVEDPTVNKILSMHMYAWGGGVTGPEANPSRALKTGLYYLRTKPKAEPIQFTIDKDVSDQLKEARKKQSLKDEASRMIENLKIENVSQSKLDESCEACSA